MSKQEFVFTKARLLEFCALLNGDFERRVKHDKLESYVGGTWIKIWDLRRAS